MSKFSEKGFMIQYKIWIALGTVLEWFYTFWMFLMHWLSFPYRYLKKYL